jgi:3-phosphoshikimate 1-carboxyvinyltransferase
MEIMESIDQLTIFPGSPLRGCCTLPGDKSISHRCLLVAAMAEGESRIENFLDAGVTRVMLDCISQLGVTIRLDDNVLRVISPGIKGWWIPAAPLNCGNSATTMRLLAGVLAVAGIPAVLQGTPELCSRPMGRIITPLQQMGVPIVGTNLYHAPLILECRNKNLRLRALDYTLPVSSAQVKSCLLFAALAADGPTILHEPGPSRDHTERLLASQGIHIRQSHENDDYLVQLTPPEKIELTPLHCSVPGDLSSAAFLIVAALITPGSEISLKNICLNPTRTGLIDVLQRMGARIEIRQSSLLGGEPVGDLVVQHSPLRSTNISGEFVVRMIDEFPAFAIAAMFAEGESIVSEAAELRLKESDRIGNLVAELVTLGACASETNDGFVIRGQPPLGGEVFSHSDHRLAMALALAGLSGKGPVTVHHSQIIGESFPNFSSTLQSLGADILVRPTL